MPQVAIVGGGISGLAAAYFLEKRAAEAGMDMAIDLIESRERLGGVIVSERSEGFLVEGGPDSFLAQKPAAIDLCRALGLAGELIPSNDQQRKTYILQNGRLKALPDGLMFLLPTKVAPILHSELFSFAGKMRLAISPLLMPRRVEGDISVADFVTERLGREVFERLAEPLLSAVYGADVATLSARAVLPRVLEMEQKYGSLWKAVRAVKKGARAAGRSPGRAAESSAREGAAAPPSSLFVSLREGIGQLAEALRKSLKRTQFVTGMEINRVRLTDPVGDSHAGYSLEATSGEGTAQAVILCTPAHAAAKLVASLDPNLSAKLAGIPYHSTLTVSLGFEQDAIRRPLDGFGFVVPRGEGKRMVACTWVSTKYAFRCPPGRVLVRAFLGGARDESVVNEDQRTVLDTVLRELDELLGVRSAPVFTRTYRWPGAMPQYNVGHPVRVQEIWRLLERHPGLYLAGNAYKGIGIPDCIDSASQAAAAAMRYLQSVA